MSECDGKTEENQASSCGGRSRRQHHRGRRKERVLHTRVSEQLSEDIKRLADDMRVPVSNLVRNVLEEVFTVVENVSEDVGDFFEDVIDEAEGVRERIRNQQSTQRSTQKSRRERSTRSGASRARRGRSSEPADIEDEFRSDEAAESVDPPDSSDEAKLRDDVLGWQPIVLNQATDCARCSARLEPGVNAFMAISPGGELGKVVCPGCTALK
jgi:gas vesicle protein